MNTGIYVQVNIGRNAHGEPMGERQWDWLASAVRDALASAVIVAYPGPDYSGMRADIMSRIEMHAGRGRWGGNSEESVHISLYVEADIDVNYLRDQLGVIARLFDQDAIALIVGSELVTA